MVTSLSQRLRMLASSLAIAGFLLVGVGGVVSANQQQVKNPVPVSSPAVSIVRNGGLEDVVSNLTPLGQDIDGQDVTITQTKKIYLPFISVTKAPEWPYLVWPFDDTTIAGITFFDESRGTYDAYVYKDDGKLLAYNCQTKGIVFDDKNFFYMLYREHDGTDNYVPPGTVVRALGDGVFDAEPEINCADLHFDRTIPIDGGERSFIVAYCHFSPYTSLDNQHVVAGQAVGIREEDDGGNSIPYPPGSPDSKLYYELHLSFYYKKDGKEYTFNPYYGPCSNPRSNPWHKSLWWPSDPLPHDPNL